MFKPSDKYPDTKAYEYVVNELARRQVSVDDIAEIAYELQQKYTPQAPREEFTDAVVEVLHKREVLSIAMTGFALDNSAEKEQLPEPLQTIISGDYSLYGVDELLAIGITNLYGTIGITNYGYVDKVKKGVIERLDTDENHVNTFADDLVGAIAVVAGARIAHHYG